MSSALKQPAADELPRALTEDTAFAGPAPDDAAAIADLQAPAASLLRFITCGSVDDGKSTLIGRLLHDTASVFDDQMEALERDSRKFGTTGGDLDFALLVDGLSAEREQGITIDVAYRYFSTARRAFIIADTPGHEQYTRNMATGASGAELAVILVDARKGILPQTRRHSFITSMVGIRSVIVAVNKMDLVGFDEGVFDAIVADYRKLLPELAFTDIAFVPISAKNGDNLASRSDRMPWYRGETLLERLESVVPPRTEEDSAPFRLPVQWVNRPHLDFRGFCGTVASGRIGVGEAIVSLPSGQKSRVKAVYGPSGRLEAASVDEAVTLLLEDEIDASRGDVLVAEGDPIRAVSEVRADILWMVDRPLLEGRRLIAKLAAAQGPATVRILSEAVDIHSFRPRKVSALSINEIGRVTLAFERPTVAAPYVSARELGCFILIDPMTNETAALGVITGVEAAAELARIGAEDTMSTAQPSTAERLRLAWLGSASRRPETARALLIFRAVASLILGIVAVLLGLGVAGALVLALADFAGRPFLWRILAPAGGSGRAPLADEVDQGGGI